MIKTAKKKTEVEIEFEATTKQFNADIKNSEKTMTSLRKELKLNATELKGDADNVELLTKRSELLSKESAESQNKIDNLNNELEEAKRLFGDDSEQVRLLSNKITDAKTQFASIQNEIQDTDKKLDSLTNSADDAENEFDDLGDSVKDTGEKAEKGSKGFTVLKGVIANIATQLLSKAVDGFKKLNDSVKEAAAIGDDVDKMSQKLGLSREGYQEWSYVLSQSGLEISSLQAGMKTMNNQIQAAIDGNKTSIAYFEKLGISISDLSKMSKEDVFGAIVASMQQMDDDANRAALANDLLGKSGQNLIPLFNQTSEATEELKNKANELGMVMSDEAVDASVEYTDAMDTLNTSASKLKSQLIAGVLPAVTDIATSLTEDVDFEEVGEKIESISSKLQTGIGKLSDAYDWTTKHKSLLIGLGVVIGIVAAGIGVYNIATALGTALKTADTVSIGGLVAAKWAENAANLALAASGMAALGPILLIVAAIAAVIAIIVLVVKNFDTIKAKGKEAIEFLSNKFNEFKEKTVAAFKAIPESIKALFENIKSKIKTPKIEITYSTDGTLGKVAQALGLEGFPKLHITWNKDGHFYTGETLEVRGYAEAGDSEYALPLNDKTLDPLAAGVVNHMSIEDSEIIEYVKALYDKMLDLPGDFETKLIDAVANRLKIMCDRRELGRVVRSY